MSKLNSHQTLHGDTIIEVMFAIATFAFVTILAIGLMNSSMSNSQAALENSMARNELSAQAEAIRFVHSAFVDSPKNSPDSVNETQALWLDIANRAVSANVAKDLVFPAQSCDQIYQKLSSVHAFILNPRALNDSSGLISHDDARFIPAAVYPRTLFGSLDPNNQLIDTSSKHAVASVEGLWAYAVKDPNNEFFDFYIQACWYGPGKTVPSTLDTIIRLYNPANFTQETP